MIKLQIIGHLGKDAILKEVNGKNVINFSVCHTEKWKDQQGNQKEKSTWVEAAYWVDKPTLAQWLTKGKQVYAEGVPEADGYQGREGEAKGTLRLRVTNIQLLGGGDSNTGAGSGATTQQQPASNNQGRPASYASNPPDGADDLPF